MIEAGRTFLFREHARAKQHLWAVLTDPVGNPATVVAVMLVSVRPHTDPTVVLDPGAHPFVRHPTAIAYSRAKSLRVDKIIHHMSGGLCHLRQDMREKVLGRIQEGLVTSPFTVNALRERCCREWGRAVPDQFSSGLAH